LPQTFKNRAAEFRAALIRHNRLGVFHWTPMSRLLSVLEHGILCRRELEARGIVYDAHGYGREGKEQDFAGHVCVSFYPQKGMMRVEPGPLVLIEMRSEIVIWEGAFYSPQNTAKSEYEFSDLVNCTSVDDLDALFEGPTEWRLRDWQAEVWIPDGIPPDQFQKMWFRNRDERDQALEACASMASSLPTTLVFGIGPTWFPSQ
jgi:ssDNA thymidine ADP-ribosyltransferase, DarT